MANRIILIRNTDDIFYPLMGRFLSRRSIVKELGYNVWDEDDKLWAVCVNGDIVLGFVGLKFGNHDIVTSLYVRPEYRNKQIGSKLLAEIVKHSTKNTVATATEKSIKLFLNHGFKTKTKHGRYTKVERIVS